MTQETLKLALEALELLSQQPTDLALDYADNAINALRERLAQPEQEPVGFVDSKLNPIQRQPLTDEQIEDIAAKTMFPINFARAIEAAHGIKENT